MFYNKLALATKTINTERKGSFQVTKLMLADTIISSLCSRYLNNERLQDMKVLHQKKLLKYRKDIIIIIIIFNKYMQ